MKCLPHVLPNARCESETVSVGGGTVQLRVQGEGWPGSCHLHIVMVRHLHQGHSRPTRTYLHSLCVTWQLLVIEEGYVILLCLKRRALSLTCNSNKGKD